MKVIDLFSGVGGLSLGASRAGFEVCGAVEIDKNALSSHRRNFPNTKHLEEDIAQLSGKRLIESLNLKNSEISGIIGGPPCQGFSCIGKNNISDPRNNLFVDFFRIVAEVKPIFYLVENVPGILNRSNNLFMERALSYVEKDYTVLKPIVICAKDLGAPTLRTRVFFIGFRNGETQHLAFEDFTPPQDIAFVTVGDSLKGLPARINASWQTEKEGWRIVRVKGKDYYSLRLQGFVPPGVGDPHALKRLKIESRVSGNLGTIHSAKVAHRYSKIEPGKRDPVSKSHKLRLDGFCPTIRAGTGNDRGRFQAVRPLHPTQNRVITPREAARLQGFPDWFQFSSTKWHSFREIGNSVSPIVAERILAVIKNIILE